MTRALILSRAVSDDISPGSKRVRRKGCAERYRLLPTQGRFEIRPKAVENGPPIIPLLTLGANVDAYVTTWWPSRSAPLHVPRHLAHASHKKFKLAPLVERIGARVVLWSRVKLSTVINVSPASNVKRR